MRAFLNKLRSIASAVRRGVAALAPVVFREGRDAVLRRTRAGTELKELAVEQKELEIGLQRATGLIDVADKIEKIQDPDLRAKLKATIFSSKSHWDSSLSLPKREGSKP